VRAPAIYTFALSCLLLAASAGAAWAAEIILYDHKNFGGRSLTLRASVPDLDDYSFDNKASAVRVISGTWELFRDDGYQSDHGPSKVLGPGDYPNLAYVGFKPANSGFPRWLLPSADNGSTMGIRPRI
jgi:hypothetical protein